MWPHTIIVVFSFELAQCSQKWTSSLPTLCGFSSTVVCIFGRPPPLPLPPFSLICCANPAMVFSLYCKAQDLLL